MKRYKRGIGWILLIVGMIVTINTVMNIIEDNKILEAQSSNYEALKTLDDELRNSHDDYEVTIENQAEKYKEIEFQRQYNSEVKGELSIEMQLLILLGGIIIWGIGVRLTSKEKQTHNTRS